jgi:uncharacterized membrane protein
MKFRVWTHYDTGIQQTIEARDEEEAINKAEENLERKSFAKQLRDNLQQGETNAFRQNNKNNND